MTQTITLPDLWLLVAPCGCLDGWLRATHEGTVTRATADVAWSDFEPTKRGRERRQAEGWVVRGGDYAEWNDGPKGHCPHIPVHTAPTSIHSGSEEDHA
jgi:hypothetical protein